VGNRSVNQVLTRNSTSDLTFQATSAPLCGGPPRVVPFIPLNVLRNGHSADLYQV
jgi:hypothetical protein